MHPTARIVANIRRRFVTATNRQGKTFLIPFENINNLVPLTETLKNFAALKEAAAEPVPAPAPFVPGDDTQKL